MSPLDSGNRWPALGVTVFALACLALWSGRGPALALVLVLVNESSSLPRGLRALDGAAVRGAAVAVVPPELAEPYLAGLGAPAGQKLLKRIAAVEGDMVCRSGDEVRTPSRRVMAPVSDRRGVTLPSWSGCRRLAASEVFLLGDTSDSFDSRYFGPVDRSRILGVYREAATW